MDTKRDTGMRRLVILLLGLEALLGLLGSGCSQTVQTELRKTEKESTDAQYQMVKARLVLQAAEVGLQEAEAQRTVAVLQYQQTGTRYQRTGTLYQSGRVTSAQYQAAEAQYQAAKAQYQATEAQYQAAEARYQVAEAQSRSPQSRSAKSHVRWQAYWNSWLQNQKPRPERLVSLEADNIKTYTFVLDLSPLKYSDLSAHAIGSVPVDPILTKEIQRLIDDQESKISLRIRPILIGTGLHMLSSENEVNKPYTFDLERLKNPDLNDDNRNALLSGTLSLEEFARKIHAGVIRFDIQATQPGCKAIALSVWNGSGNRPLDHLVHEFSVHAPGEKPPDCGIRDNPLRGGLDTLLTSMLSGDVHRRIEADAGLHIFEMRSYGRTYSHAVYMQRETLNLLQSVDGSLRLPLIQIGA